MCNMYYAIQAKVFLPVYAFTDNYYLEILSVTNLNSAGKFPQNGIEVAN